MGTLIYGGVYEIELDDRTLTHLQITIGLKLRRHEGCFFTWSDASGGGGTTTIWLDPAIALVFKFNGGRRPSLNRAWLEEMSTSANSSQGLQLTEETELVAVH